MPNRILRPWVDSEAVNGLTEAGEVFFIRLIMCADDYGRFYGSPQLLKSYLYPLKDKRVADISRLIAECVKAGLIADYEVSGKRYIQIVKFRQQVRRRESKFPPPQENGESEVKTQSECASSEEQMQGKCVANANQMRSRCVANDKQTHSKCSPNTKTETETFKMDSGLHPSSITPKPGESPGSSGKRNAVFFDYTGDGKIHGITPEQIQYWRETYPAIDVEAELNKATAWLDANRKNRKIDVKRFLVNWFNRTQDRAKPVRETRANSGHPSFDYAPDESGTDESRWFQ